MNIYYIEYSNSIKFFNNDKTIEIEKNKKTYKLVKKLINDKRFNLINLL